MGGSPAGWNQDPYGRHEQRYFDGTSWTEHVSDFGVQGVDPPGGAPAPPRAPTPTYQAPVRQQRMTPKKKVRWPWVLLGIFGVMVIGVGGCAVLVGVGVNEAVKSFNEEQRRHAISQTQSDAVALGTPRDTVISTLGKQPENTQSFSSEASNVKISSSCVYYWQSNRTFGHWYQFCFDGTGNLLTKNSY
jgi:hypothetical protein